jgi:two-component system, LytTR family, response regulator
VQHIDRNPVPKDAAAGGGTGVRVLIVDDEPLARRGVIARLKRINDIEIVGECGDGTSAAAKILESHPDLVFLDVQMPGMDGFEVLRALPRESWPAVIFLTAYEQHALRAFEVHALDYLLKPIDDERFAVAIHRAQQFADSQAKSQLDERILRLLDENSDKYASRFAVRTGSRIQVVFAEDIEWVGTAGDYTELHSRGRAHLLRETMNTLERRLDPTQFIRVHRSRIVRLKCVRELRTIGNREYIIKLSDGSEHRASRSYADQLEQWLSSSGR